MFEKDHSDVVRSNVEIALGVSSPSGERTESVFLRSLIQGMRCGVLIVDAERRLVLLNEPARRILELESVPSVGTPIDRAFPCHTQLVHALCASFDMDNPPNRAELHVDTGSNRTKSIGFTVSMVRGDDGELHGAAMFFKDLTPIELGQEQERLKDRLVALGQMAASMAHEIRNPLASIEITCDLLKRRLGPDSDDTELLGKITSEVRRLNRSLNACLQYVRPVSMNLAHSDLGSVLDEAIDVAEGRRGRPTIRVSRRFAGDIPPLLIDQWLLRQVFVNLVLNAFEAVGDAGEVCVETSRIDAPDAAGVPYPPPEATDGDPWSRAEEFVLVRIADNGTGIADEHRERIFQPFFTTKEQGSGIGLALAKKIVCSHHGLIDVNSTPGEGAEILVRLPLVPETVGGLTA